MDQRNRLNDLGIPTPPPRRFAKRTSPMLPTMPLAENRYKEMLSEWAKYVVHPEHDRRAHPRRSVVGEINLLPVNGQTFCVGERLHGSLCDRSVNGIGFTTNAPLGETNGLFVVELILSKMLLIVRIAWSKQDDDLNLYHHGASILDYELSFEDLLLNIGMLDHD